MEKELPRIEAVTVDGPSTLHVRWRGDKHEDTVNLIGWIATGGDILAPLRDPEVFAQAAVESHGRAVGWGDDDLAIDALHLKKLAEEQRPFGNSAVCEWQDALELSNREAADLIGVSLSTWNTYKVAAAIPRTVAMLLRATRRDPLLMQAHLRPRTAGRPKKVAGTATEL
jgi:hypothetical protein